MYHETSLLLLCGPVPDLIADDLYRAAAELEVRDEMDDFLVRCDFPLYGLPVPPYLSPEGVIFRDQALSYPTDEDYYRFLLSTARRVTALGYARDPAHRDRLNLISALAYLYGPQFFVCLF